MLLSNRVALALTLLLPISRITDLQSLLLPSPPQSRARTASIQSIVRVAMPIIATAQQRQLSFRHHIAAACLEAYQKLQVNCIAGPRSRRAVLLHQQHSTSHSPLEYLAVAWTVLQNSKQHLSCSKTQTPPPGKRHTHPNNSGHATAPLSRHTIASPPSI